MGIVKSTGGISVGIPYYSLSPRNHDEELKNEIVSRALALVVTKDPTEWQLALARLLESASALASHRR